MIVNLTIPQAELLFDRWQCRIDGEFGESYRFFPSTKFNNWMAECAPEDLIDWPQKGLPHYVAFKYDSTALQFKLALL
jgi:hypothetical protein